ncbi:holo-ACP synthase [Fusobacterium gonidiaformans]|uniref:holo-ACP synthase n=1 Tax=Fusobacterium gonidiaformans TaxID=849 RepID=UPI0023F502C8|nr:holo-ACP synthase [Fusobacterium gonidiaformans]
MIRGIGTDIIEISRIEKAMKKIQFLQKVFTEKEQEEQKARGEKMESYAAIFSAKEAIVKAMGTGFRGISFTDIEILHDDLGKPLVYLYGIAQNNWHISLSHCKEYAVAIAIWEE